MDAFFFHFIDIGLKVRKVFLIDCEIFVVFHVIDIHVYHIDRNIVFTISVSSFSEVVSSCISPAALTETNHIQIKICILTGDLYLGRECVTDIKLQFSGIINEETESLFSGDYDEVVCSVEGDFIFCMVWLVGTVAFINVSTFVDSAV